MKMLLEYPDLKEGIKEVYDKKREEYEAFISEEDQYISDLPFNILL